MQHLEPEFTRNYKIKSPGGYKIGTRFFSTSDLARLSGAPDGTNFAFEGRTGRISITGHHPHFFEDGKPMERFLANTDSGLMLFNAQFQIRSEYRRKGVGFKMLNGQLEACRELGIPSVACLAGRWGKDDEGRRVELDGYMVWPMLGFDGPIPDKVSPNLSPDFSDRVTVQQLIRTQEGLAEWKLKGDSCRLTFEVDPSSVHSQTFAAYGKRKGFIS